MKTMIVLMMKWKCWGLCKCFGWCYHLLLPRMFYWYILFDLIYSLIYRGGSADDDFVVSDAKKQPQESFVNQAFRTTTPPPNSRLRRTSTPPGAVPLVRTSSRHSKSSSDGSFGTPAPASPPYSKSHSKPPARGRGSQSSKARGSSDISEPVYKNFWMCGFTDAFKFDGFKE